MTNENALIFPFERKIENTYIRTYLFNFLNQKNVVYVNTNRNQQMKRIGKISFVALPLLVR